ncbi:hypothetical protein CAPTEDRAFT_189038 [Capitella teleta]|uniref:Uncharacterized protein n=1 Tax=Capitella teleta TaxID=283909 RepID=R7TBJ1_CAPTE|nr:hypothetical protein CAPTEDRAFT_189038 [Capitella teleta]|eukprot:ELT90832.1 hypothetical protein CAPTEDRAFT_189038 [Capitella teleta]
MDKLNIILQDINSFLRQDLTLATGVRYFFSAHVRLMNEMNEKGHQIEMYVGYKIGTLNNTHFGENHTFASKKLRKSQFCFSYQYDQHNTHCDYRGYVVEDINSFLRQDLTLATGVRYFFSAHVRLMNEMNEKGHQIEMYVGYKIGNLFYEMLLS